ncbi:N-substituted formamide deformylase precursor [bacterium YEK0313]|nr:N-substituted formamide deformylase precursor [bacterium YEK0313]
MSLAADAIFHNGRIYTVDAARSWASAVAVAGGRILAVGDDGDILALRGPATTVTDLRGRMMLPALGDIHNHHARGGELDLYELNFTTALDFDGILALVAERAARVGPDAWICGGIWSSALGPRLADPASRAALDEAAGGRPVSLIDDSLHNRWVSSRALQLAGITRDTPDPKDGFIQRDGRGEPTGVLIEKAMALVTRAAAAAIEDPVAHLALCSRRAVEILNGYGITSFQDATSTLEMMQALHRLDANGELNARVVVSLPAYDTLNGASLFGEALIARREEFRTPRLRPDFVKFFNDGVPMTRTAAMFDAYRPAEDGSVMVCHPFLSQPDLVRWIRRAARHGMGIKIHCAGDLAVHATLDAIEIVRDIDGPGPMHQIAHPGYVRPDDIPRFARLNVLADLCPALWMPSTMIQAIVDVVPAERARRYWPFRDMQEAGVLMAGGSDWPVLGLPDPWFGLHGMVTRSNPRAPELGTFWPEQALDLSTAIEVYTINVARGMGLAAETGSIEPGKSADLIVLDRNLFDIAPAEIARTRVLQTWFEGRLVHEA